MSLSKNKQAFQARLETEYVELFKNSSEYAYSASRITPKDLAEKMTSGLITGAANKDGEGIKRVCAHFKIPHNYKAIKNFLTSQE